MRNRLVTVRLPGARMAPVSNTSACRQLRWKNSGANARMTAAKRGGREGMALSLGGDAFILTHRTLRRPLNRQPSWKWPKPSLNNINFQGIAKQLLSAYVKYFLNLDVIILLGLILLESNSARHFFSSVDFTEDDICLTGGSDYLFYSVNIISENLQAVLDCCKITFP